MSQTALCQLCSRALTIMWGVGLFRSRSAPAWTVCTLFAMAVSTGCTATSAPVPSESSSHAGMVESGSAPALPATSSTESPAAQQSHDDCPVSHALRTDAAPKDMRPVMAASAQPVPWIEGWRGNDALWVGLPAQTTVPAQPDPDQAGWLVTKFPWWRLAAGDLTVRAKRLDGPADFRSSIPNGAYGDSGFIPSGLYWSAPGCWQLTGDVSGQSLTVVIRVQRQP